MGIVPGASFDTICLHGGWDGDKSTGSAAIPVHRTSPYIFKDTETAANLFALRELGMIYSRLGNPTTDVLERRFALLSGAHENGALALASGTAAAFNAIINLASAGDNIVSSSALYGGTFTMFNDILPQMGIKAKFVKPSDFTGIAAAIDSKTRAIYAETVANPSLQITDLEALADVAKAHGVPLVIDDTFTTPYLTRPIEWGADVVVHSLTKWSGGHGTGIGGILVDGGKFNWGSGRHPLFDVEDKSYGGLRWGHDLPASMAKLAYIIRARTVPLRNLGACIAPDNSWMFLQGLETLPLRMERHCSNARAVAEFLSTHPAVEWVRFPGLKGDPMAALNDKYLKGKGGSMVVFGVKGGLAAGGKFIESLEMVLHVANVGDAKTLAIHPATTTHSQLDEAAQRAGGITPDLIRMSVGIEDPSDIMRDIDQALRRATA
jgi:O-acetylhomoserine (thiol)-lyase